MRILCVGDSMTIGCAGDHTWRYRIWRHLTVTHHAPFQMVGPRTSLHEGSQDYADPGFPAAARGHLAGWGEGWVHHAEHIGEAVRGTRADTLLISLGLIDLGFYTDAAQTAANVRRFLSGARRAAPRLRAALLPVIPNIRAVREPEFAAECAHFNALLATAVAGLSSARSPLLLAAPPPGWEVERDTYDGTHPSTEGEHRIAAAFAEALYRGWGVGAPYPVHAALPVV